MNSIVKYYLVYFVIKNTLKVVVIYQIRKRNITIKSILLVIKKKLK